MYIINPMTIKTSFIQWELSDSIDGLSISPIFQYQLDLFQYFILFIYIILILDILPSHISLKPLLGLSFGFMLMQLINYTYMISNRELYIQEQLNDTWQSAYENNHWLIQALEDDWKCKGFHHKYDRNSHEDDHAYNTACYYSMVHQFGEFVYHWALILWFIKWLQAFGGLLFFILYDRFVLFRNKNEHDLDHSDIKNMV
ncbi:unnamed protein product [Cunninghamella blakesleeana]